MKKFLLTAFLAVLGLALPAMAQVQANLGDLVLGFRATGGQGQNVNLEIDLGSVAQFQGQPAGTNLVLSRLAVNDLIATYGANWATRTDLYWGVVGTAGRISAFGSTPVGTLWATNAETTVGTQSLAWTPDSRGAQFNASANIEALFFGAPGSINGATPTANSTNSATINATIAGSYTSQNTVQSGVSFGFFNPSIDNTVKADASGYAVSDLYEIRIGGASSTYLGSFGLQANGTLTFSTSPTFFTAAAAGAPVITAQPIAQSVQAGANVTLSVTATGAGTLSYQWFKDGTAISGATSSTLSLPGVTSANAGNYSVKISNAVSSVTSTGIAVSVGAVANQGRLVNLSVLTSIAGAGDNFTFGFVVGGSGTSGNKPMLMRAAGPALTQLGVGGVLPDPVMQFYNGSTLVSQNAGWNGDSSVLTTANAVGAFPYGSATSKDSAIYVSAIPLGNDSVRISSASSASGTVIAELYDATPTAQFVATTPRLINVSVLKQLGTGVTLGFVIGGSSNLKVMIRAIGPGLSAVGVNSGTSADPKLTLFNSANTSIASNDDWGTPVGTGAATAAQITAAATSVNAFAIPSGSKDAVILATLAPGLYTAQAAVSTGANGLTIIEVYEVP
jgi:hypothetical protein